MTSSPVRRSRGRPRGGGGDARELILAAAIEEFSALGYDGATIRGIAQRAGVDPALVHHYFGTKADLFSDAVGAPMRPDLEVQRILAGPRDEVGVAIVRYLLTAWEKPDVRKRGTLLLRSAIGNRAMTPMLAGFLARELLSRIAGAVGTPDADLRAALAASQVAGLLVTRYILKLPALTSASVEELVLRVGPTIQRYLVDDTP